MNFEKKRLSKAEDGYSINAMTLLGQPCVVAAAEGTGPGMVFPIASLTPSVIATSPGGCMGFAEVPNRDDAMLMITGFYPIFKAETAGIHLFISIDGFNIPWRGFRVLDLPFVHRIAGISRGSESFLIAATVCGGKDFQDDWSKPGAVYAAQFPGSIAGPWEAQKIFDGIHRNHGMSTGQYQGIESAFVSADEGIFAISPPLAGDDLWKIDRLFDKAVSEFCFADLDGDGEDELAVIEPFHGDAMTIYKKIGSTWTRVFSMELGFGHGLWTGKLTGEAVVIAGNRSGTKNLVCFRVTSRDPFAMEELVIDQGSGTTNLDVLRSAGGDAIVASNPEYGEYALYQVSV
ncbi:MAG: hypothetical protein HN368_05715 [Spirochaetales bacterium]|jgi:hypothetical protein|nr:hypothetical protein [Spirochaetales bacterium]